MASPERPAAYDPDFEALRAWALEHVDALPDLDEVDSDAASIIVALRGVLVGETGCTDESDYTTAQWRVLMLCKEASARV